MDDSRARFLSAIVQQLGAEHIVELHLFSPLRQGVLETGVAVVAAAEPPALEAAGPGEDDGHDAPSSSHAVSPSSSENGRHIVYTARYRFTRKGPERGSWFFECAATADAPLATVDAVVRGVMLRSKDLTESERLSGEQLRQLLEDPAWRTPV